MEFIPAGGSYNQRCNLALKGINGITKMSDDVLIALGTYNKNESGVLEILNRCE